MKRLYKKQKLCSTVAIGLLFGSAPGTHRTLTYPLRAVWRENPGRRCDAPVQMLISIPKKRLRHAVDRVKMRRRVREAFRLNHQSFPFPEGARIDLAFIYVGSNLEPYTAVEQAVRRILGKVSDSASAHTATDVPAQASTDNDTHAESPAL